MLPASAPRTRSLLIIQCIRGPLQGPALQPMCPVPQELPERPFLELAYRGDTRLLRPSEEGKGGTPRCGEVVVKDWFTGRDHMFMIVASHQYLIAEGWYTIFSSLNNGLHSEDSRYWVCCVLPIFQSVCMTIPYPPR